MPHIILEYTDNIIEKNDMPDLFKQCHATLAELLPTDIENCKSRAIELTNYYFGTGSKDNALVHVTLKIMPGRTLELRENVAEKLILILKQHFINSFENLKLQISISIEELPKPYLKILS